MAARRACPLARHARRRARGGFTLVEVVVVLAILAVAAAVSVPALLARAEEPPIDAATRHFEMLFRLARDSALRSAAPVTVVIDSATARVWLTARGVAADPPEGTVLELPPGVRVQLGAARARFRFDAGGGAMGDSITLRGATETRRLTLDPWRGDVVVR
jgi:general secretion pathway protein H